MTSQPFGPEEKRKAKQELRNAQTKAEWVPKGDVNEIRFLDNLAARRARARKFLEDDTDYDTLKAKILARLDSVPALKFYDDLGRDRYATAYRSNKLVVDVALLEKIMRELGYDDATIDKVIPRKHDAEALRRLVSSRRGEALRNRLPEYAREIPHISYVVFTDPVNDEEVDDVT